MAVQTDQPLLQSDSAKAPTFATIGAASGVVVAANTTRVGVYITNDHATQVLYLGFGAAAVVGSGIRVNAAGGQVYIPNFTGAINGIATGAATNVCVQEIGI